MLSLHVQRKRFFSDLSREGPPGECDDPGGYVLAEIRFGPRNNLPQRKPLGHGTAHTTANGVGTQDSANCALKQQGTESWFKPTVRILKNMRNRMIDKNMIEEGPGPFLILGGHALQCTV